MAMDNMRLGSAIAATIQSFKPADGTKVTASLLEQMWQAVAQDFIDEVKNHADIVLEGAEINIPAAGLLDSMAAPVTGAATNAPATQSGKIE